VRGIHSILLPMCPLHVRIPPPPPKGERTKKIKKKKKKKIMQKKLEMILCLHV
jgi:hypothetical protein